MLFLNSYSLPYSFTHVASSLFQKYPNPSAPHVKSVDVLSCSVLPGNVLRTERLIGVEQNCPAWILRLLGGSSKAWIRETTFVSLSSPSSEPVILSSSTNLSMCSLLSLRETISYSPSSSGSTSFRALADARAGKTAEMLRKRVEKWSIERYEKNAGVGREGFLTVLERRKKEVLSDEGGMEVQSSSDMEGLIA
ncbi:MSF1-domain-containing protein [Atractiella rhizophila]|nr:MSF1-domain-containing protein [Atractiella rhizophila]